MEKLSLQDALAILLSHADKIDDTECIRLWDCRGRVLAEDLKATRPQPPFDRSPLDGYAVRSSDIASASGENPSKLHVIDEVCAGHVSDKKVESGTAIRIMTGAPIPEGADCVVGQEDTDYGDKEVLIYQNIGHYQNYCFAGEDYKAGKCLLKKGSLIGVAEVGTIASLGMDKVLVYRKPRVAVISTGDEIIEPGADMVLGKIYDSNLYTVVAQLESYGAEVVYRECASDDSQFVASRIMEMAENVDLIVTTGGVSVGKMDIMHDVLNILDIKPLFWKVAIKPGMPTLTSIYNGKLMICLSGNPYGAFANTQLLVKPTVLKIANRPDYETKRVKATILNAYPKKSPVTRYVRAYYENNVVRLADGSNDSGIFSNLCGCNCMVEIPQGTGAVENGEEVTVVLL